MKLLRLVLLLATLLISLPTFADNWTHEGPNWTTGACSITVPEAFKVSVKGNNLNAETDTALAVLMPMPTTVPPEKIMPILETEAAKAFKGSTFGEAKTVSQDGMDCTVKIGKMADVVITLATFVKWESKVAVMTFQKAEDKATDAVLSQMMNSLSLK